MMAANGADADTLLDDLTKIRAVLHGLLIVGEVCKKAPNDFRHHHPEFDWPGFARLRDKLIHHYWGLDYFLMCDAIQE